MDNKFVATVTKDLKEKGLEKETIKYVVGKMKRSFGTGVWVGKQQTRQSA